MPTRSFRRIIDILDAHHVEYIGVGGVAAVLQGAPVTTFALDALIDVEAANVDRVVGALGELDARFREHRDLPTRGDVAAGGRMLLMTGREAALRRDKDLAVVRLLEAVPERQQN